MVEVKAWEIAIFMLALNAAITILAILNTAAPLFGAIWNGTDYDMTEISNLSDLPYSEDQTGFLGSLDATEGISFDLFTLIGLGINLFRLLAWGSITYLYTLFDLLLPSSVALTLVTPIAITYVYGLVQFFTGHYGGSSE